METLAIISLLAGVFCTAVGVVIEDMSMFIYAGVFYSCCWGALTRMSKEREVG